MDTTEQDIDTMKTQLEEWKLQINILTVKRQAAAKVAQQFAQELLELRAKHRAYSAKVRDFELHRNSGYMWENIGDGG